MATPVPTVILQATLIAIDPRNIREASELKQCHKKLKQAEAEVVPSSGLVEVDVEYGVEVGVESYC